MLQSLLAERFKLKMVRETKEMPVYVLVAPAFISLVQAHALREIRRRHGDLVAETEEEVSRL